MNQIAAQIKAVNDAFAARKAKIQRLSEDRSIGISMDLDAHQNDWFIDA